MDQITQKWGEIGHAIQQLHPATLFIHCDRLKEKTVDSMRSPPDQVLAYGSILGVF